MENTPGCYCPPLASNSNIRNGNNDFCHSDVTGEDEEGEPPNISTLLGNYISVVSNEPLDSTIMAVGRVHRGVGVRKLSSMFAVVMFIICNQSMLLCAAEAGVDATSGIPVVDNDIDSHGVRGAIGTPFIPSQQDFDQDTNGDDCNYECCLSFIDIINSQKLDGNGDYYLLGYDDEQNEDGKLSHYMVQRMLQETTNSTEPAPCTPEEEEGGGVPLPVWAQYLFIVILVSFSALFSGLTLGLMSLDPSGLEIVMANADDPQLARAAKAIYPVRLNGNLLLCTLLLGNVGVNSMLSIIMADLTSGLVGFIVSTAVIVVFGEIIPQAVCSRFALQIGKKTVPLVKVIMLLLYPLCKPMSMILNKVLGHEIGTTYNASEMAKLIEMHVARGHLESTTGAAMTGALRYRTIPVSEVMTPLVNTFMLSADERLGFDTVAKIFKTGYSRIPVYEVSPSNIIGLLFVKDLIFLDPEDEIPVKNFVQIFGRGLHVVWLDDNLGGVLKLLKRGRSHMALVRGVNDGNGEVDPFYEIKGIITLEDVVEEILGDEIIDETDELVDVNNPDTTIERSTSNIGDYIGASVENSSTGPVMPLVGSGVSDRGSTRSIDWEARLRLLDERLVDEHLSPEEARAVCAHLKTNYSKAVELISEKQLKELLSTVPVSEISPASTCTTEDGGGDDCSGVPTDSAELIYERGVPADFCTVVLQGKIVVMSGGDKFRSDVSNWGVLASRALTDPSYVPDFSAWVLPNQSHSGGCRCVKLDRKSFYDAVDNTALERTDNAIPALAMAVASAPEDSLVPSATVSFAAPKSADQIDSSAKLSIPPSPPKPYVQSFVQRKVNTRRSQLLKAFNRAANPEDTKE